MHITMQIRYHDSQLLHYTTQNLTTTIRALNARVSVLFA